MTLWSATLVALWCGGGIHQPLWGPKRVCKQLFSLVLYNPILQSGQPCPKAKAPPQSEIITPMSESHPKGQTGEPHRERHEASDFLNFWPLESHPGPRLREPQKPPPRPSESLLLQGLRKPQMPPPRPPKASPPRPQKASNASSKARPTALLEPPWPSIFLPFYSIL